MRAADTIFVICSLLAPAPSFAQDELPAQFQAIDETLKGHLGVHALHLETGESASVHANERFPMQSVYKLPIAMVMLCAVDEGRFALDDVITISPGEYIPQRGHSPIRDRFPGGTRMTLEEVLAYNTTESDGTACDVLLRLLGGPASVQAQIRALGVADIAIATTEMVQVANDTIQYQNWSTPRAMNQVLRILQDGSYVSGPSRALLLRLASKPSKYMDKRIKGQLPAGTPVAHKTGTAGTYDGLTRACNDAGIVTLPDGSHLLLSVFIMDSRDTPFQRETAIAKVAKAAYEHWAK